MDRQSTAYTFLFAAVICVVCSVSLSAVSEGLRPKKEFNVAIDIKKNILKAVALEEPLSPKATADEMSKIFDQKIQAIVVDEQGNVIDDKTPEDAIEGSGLHPIYVYKEGSSVKSYCIPIIGKGLWSTLYGYFAIEPDAKTVRGITFYQHGETPGLGAEIEKPWFQDNFKGKKIWDDQGNMLKPVSLVKGQVTTVIRDQSQQQYYVDGISGATITANGVTEMIGRWLNVYEPYFSKVRN